MDARELVALARDFGFPAVVALLLLFKLDRTLTRVCQELHQLRLDILALLAKPRD